MSANSTAGCCLTSALTKGENVNLSLIQDSFFQDSLTEMAARKGRSPTIENVSKSDLLGYTKRHGILISKKDQDSYTKLIRVVSDHVAYMNMVEKRNKQLARKLPFESILDGRPGTYCGEYGKQGTLTLQIDLQSKVWVRSGTGVYASFVKNCGQGFYVSIHRVLAGEFNIAQSFGGKLKKNGEHLATYMHAILQYLNKNNKAMT